MKTKNHQGAMSPSAARFELFLTLFVRTPAPRGRRASRRR